MDAAQALADLTEISSQIVHVAIVGADGAVLASTLADEEHAGRFAGGALRLLEAADEARIAHGLTGLVQLEAVTLDGSVFIVKPADSTLLIAAATRPEPTVGLVFYDLKHCLKATDAPSNPAAGNAQPGNGEQPAARSRTRRRAKEPDASA